MKKEIKHWANDLITTESVIRGVITLTSEPQTDDLRYKGKLYGRSKLGTSDLEIFNMTIFIQALIEEGKAMR